jgi:hypothetical protein
MADGERHRVLADLVRGEILGVLGHSGTQDFGERIPFQQLGFDSLTAVELRNRIAGATGVRLASTVVFDHPTTADLTDHLMAELTARTADVPASNTVSDAVGQLVAAIAATPAELDREQADRLRALLRATRHEPEQLDTASDDELFTLVDSAD